MVKNATNHFLDGSFVKWFLLFVAIITVIGSTFAACDFFAKEEIRKDLFTILLCSHIVIWTIVGVTFLVFKISKNKITLSEKKAKDELDSVNSLSALRSEFNGDIINVYENISQKTRQYISSIFVKNQDYLDFIKVIEKKAKNLHLIQEEDKQGYQNDVNDRNKSYINDLFYLYNVYIEMIIDDAKKIIEKSVGIKGYSLRVSVALKLLNKLIEKDDTHKDVKVFTAFRDSETNFEKKREVLEVNYKIDKNIDFLICLDKPEFIINNAKKESKDYTNEHTDFDRYYNCSATVPIFSSYADRKIFFGYLCCDVLNDKYDGEDIFTIIDAKILSFFASNMAMFFDNINTSFKNMIGKDFIDFNHHIHKYSMKGEQK